MKQICRKFLAGSASAQARRITKACRTRAVSRSQELAYGYFPYRTSAVEHPDIWHLILPWSKSEANSLLGLHLPKHDIHNYRKSSKKRRPCLEALMSTLSCCSFYLCQQFGQYCGISTCRCSSRGWECGLRLSSSCIKDTKEWSHISFNLKCVRWVGAKNSHKTRCENWHYWPATSLTLVLEGKSLT